MTDYAQKQYDRAEAALREAIREYGNERIQWGATAVGADWYATWGEDVSRLASEGSVEIPGQYTLTGNPVTVDLEIDTETPLDVWLKFEDESDGEPTHTANTFRNEDGTYRVEWYLNAVGQVTTVEFPTYEEAVEWYAREGFQDFSS